MRQWILRTFLPPLIVMLLICAALEVMISIGWIREFMLPRPSDVARSLWVDRLEIGVALRDTAIAAFAGFFGSGVVGILLAIFLSLGGWVQRAFYPYAVFFQTVPIIAIAPLLVIWFGLDIRAVIASAFIVSIFPVIAATLSGLLSVDPALRDLFRLYNASPIGSLFKLRLPFALPSILTGLRISAGLAVIGAIAGEFVTNGGLGGMIFPARQQRHLDKVFATLLVASLLGIVMFGMINLISSLALRHWHASESKK